MLLDTSRNVQTEGLSHGHAFKTTENSTKLFAMLSNFLYKDKERAVLTELSSNALDAHKLVGKEAVPIDVSLPTQLVPEVHVRDFGPGLSEEQVVQFLTTYGESSKQQSQEFIGGFGIGSKSPAAVTDTWTVHSYHNGVHKQYLIFVSAAGVPSLTKITEKATTESGLHVVIPVQKDRINAWSEAAKRTYVTYSVRPKINNSNFVLPKISWVYDGKYMGIPTGISETQTSAHALINNRLYKIDSVKVLDQNYINTIEGMIMTAGIVLKFDIGDLSLSLSREDLQYDQKTISNIKEKLRLALEELKHYWMDTVANHATEELDYFIRASAAMQNIFVSAPSQRNGIYEFLGKGEKHYSYAFAYGRNIITLPLKSAQSFKTMQQGSDKILSKSRYNRFFTYNESYWYNKPPACSVSMIITGIREFVFVEDDGVSHINMRVRQKYGSDDINNSRNVVISDNFDFLPAFLKSQIVKGSSLPKPVIVRKPVNKSSVQSEYYAISGGRFIKVEDTYFKGAQVVYVYFTSASSVKSIVNGDQSKLELCKDLKYVVLGLKAGTKPPTWAMTLDQALEIELQKLEGCISSLYEGKFSSETQRFIFGGRTEKTIMANLFKTKHDSVWNKYIDMMIKGYHGLISVTTNEIKLKLYISLVSKLNKKVIPDHTANIVEEFNTTYPLLELIVSGHRSLTKNGVYDKIIQYVDMIGK